jgi:predicted permease
MITDLLHRLSYLLGRRRFDAELDAELQFHLETRADDLEASGLARPAALAQARREFGNTARMQEETRSAWQFRWLEDLASDLRYATRGLRRNPAFAATAIACLALGIGANTTIFSVTSEMLFSRPSVRDPQTLLYLRVGGMSHVPLPEFRFLRDARPFPGLAGLNAGMQTNWRSGDTTSRLFTVQVTDNFFDVSGTPLALGRGIQPGDGDVAVVTWRFWQRLDRDPDILGRKLILDGRPFTVVGVLPRAHHSLFGFGVAHDLYLPAANDQTAVALYARIPAGMTKSVARSRAVAAAQAFDAVHPGLREKRAANVRVNDVYGVNRLAGESGFMPVAAFFGMLMAVVSLVLLIACANVASLLVARASSRSQELAIRISIGAGRGRVVRQLLAESLLLGVCGAVAGLWLNLVLISAIARVQLPLPLPIEIAPRPDWALLLYAATIAVGSSLVAGLAPAFQSTRAGLAATLKRGERQLGGGWNLRNALVVGQLAASIVLLCAGFIFMRNLAQATGMNPGFDIEHTLWASVRLVPESYTTPGKTGALVDTALDRLRATPGVDAVSVLRTVPLNDETSIGASVHVDGGSNAIHLKWYQNDVSPDYFRAIGIPLRAGREFQPADRDVAILNQNMARALFGAANPVGRSLQTEPLGRLTVVGVVGNSSYLSLADRGALALYRPYDQPSLPGQHSSELHFMVRAAGTPESILSAVRATLDRLDPTAAIDIRPMHSALTFALLPSQAGALVLGSVGLLGLTLASIGLYGVLLYSVSRRVREIGVRVALGATPGAVLQLVLRHSLGLVSVGIGAGMLLAIFAVRPLAMFLIPDVRPTDPLNFLTVGAVLAAVALIATIAPAVRALRVDPLTALRHD